MCLYFFLFLWNVFLSRKIILSRSFFFSHGMHGIHGNLSLRDGFISHRLHRLHGFSLFLIRFFALQKSLYGFTQILSLRDGFSRCSRRARTLRCSRFCYLVFSSRIFFSHGMHGNAVALLVCYSGFILPTNFTNVYRCAVVLSPTDYTDFFASLKILATLGNLSKLNCPCLSQEFLDFRIRI